MFPQKKLFEGKKECGLLWRVLSFHSVILTSYEMERKNWVEELVNFGNEPQFSHFFLFF